MFIQFFVRLLYISHIEYEKSYQTIPLHYTMFHTDSLVCPNANSLRPGIRR